MPHKADSSPSMHILAMFVWIITILCYSRISAWHLSSTCCAFDWHLLSTFLFIYSGYFYSASSSPLPLSGAPDTAWILCQSFTPKCHRELRVKYLPKVPAWRLEQDSNPRLFERKMPNLPPRPVCICLAPFKHALCVLFVVSKVFSCFSTKLTFCGLVGWTAFIRPFILMLLRDSLTDWRQFLILLNSIILRYWNLELLYLNWTDLWREFAETASLPDNDRQKYFWRVM